MRAIFLAFSLLLALTTGCSYSPFRRAAPFPGRTTLDSPQVSLGAQIVGNFLIVEGKWDRFGPYHFVVDTGSANTLVSPALFRRYGSGGGRGESARVAGAEGDIRALPAGTLDRIQLGGARFENVPVLVYDCAALSAHLGVRIDGVLGFPLFRHTRLTLDYPRSRVLLEPLETVALVPGQAVAYESRRNIPMIQAKVGQKAVTLLIDSGSDATLSLNPDGLDVTFTAPPRRGATVGTLAGDHPQHIGRLAETVSLAGFALPQPVVDLTTQFSAIGGGFLKHFTLTFDPAAGRVSFLRDEPGPIATPARRSAGLSFSKTPAYWRVAGVIPDSPAEQVGVQFGDLVTRINGEPVARWNLSRYEQLVASSREITFDFLFGSSEVRKQVAVFELVP